mgnify:CR=1 FL=1
MARGFASFEERQETETEHTKTIYDYLYKRPETVGLTTASVEVQKKEDIDFFWMRAVEAKIEETSVELKVDTQGHETGNFAFETVSNETRGTLGCFLRTNSDLFFYYLAGSNELWVMETRRVQQWFLDEMKKTPKRFQPFETYTKLNDGTCYSSYGRLVPIEDVKAVGKLIGLKKAVL